MKTSKQLVILGIALLGLAIGYLGDPVGASVRILKSADFETLQLSSKFVVKKSEKDLSHIAEIFPRSIPPKYSDLMKVKRIAESVFGKIISEWRGAAVRVPKHSDRTPAPIENSYFDAKMEDLERLLRLGFKRKSFSGKHKLQYFQSKIWKYFRLPENKNY